MASVLLAPIYRYLKTQRIHFVSDQRSSQPRTLSSVGTRTVGLNKNYKSRCMWYIPKEFQVQKFSTQGPFKPWVIYLDWSILRNSPAVNLSSCALNVHKLSVSCYRYFHYISALTEDHLVSATNVQLSQSLFWNRQWLTDVLCCLQPCWPKSQISFSPFPRLPLFLGWRPNLIIFQLP